MARTIPAVEVTRGAPRILVSDQVTPNAAVETFGYRAPARYTAPAIRFSDAQPLLVAGNRFTIVSEATGLVPTSTYLFDEYSWSDLFTGRPERVRSIETPTLVAGNAAWANHFHWLFQCLPTLMLARSVGLDDCHAIVPPLGGVQRTMLELTGISPDRVTPLPDGEIAVLQRGIHSNLTGPDFPFAPHPAVIDACRELAQSVPASGLRGRRIFVSRADSRQRRMVNEEALQQQLASAGFEIVVPGMLGATEQIALFRDAAIIVGQHGAALTNLLFAPDGEDGPSVVELQQENYPALGFAKICQAKRLRYTAVVSRMVDPGADGRHDSTWEADIPLILRALADLPR